MAGTCTFLQKIVHGEAAQPLWEVLYRKCYPEGLVLGGPTGGHRQALCAELSTWRALARSLDPPTLQQMANVVGRSANAHSYYKHLNIGRVWPFHFRISAVAGMRAERRDGRTYYVDYVRGDGTEFHYTWTPTAAYRERFGVLQYGDLGWPRERLPAASLPLPWPDAPDDLERKVCNPASSFSASSGTGTLCEP